MTDDSTLIEAQDGWLKAESLYENAIIRLHKANIEMKEASSYFHKMHQNLCTAREELIQQRLTVQQKSTDWIPVDKKLINSHDPMLYEKLWIRHKSGEILTGTYEWQQGWDPDKFVTDGYGTIWAYEATHIMPFVIPNPPKEIKND